jgi:hypothetical protein
VCSGLSIVCSGSLRLSDRGYQIEAVGLRLRVVSEVVEIGWGYVAGCGCNDRGCWMEAT